MQIFVLFFFFFLVSLHFHELDLHGAHEVCPPMPLKGISKIRQLNKTFSKEKMS